MRFSLKALFLTQAVLAGLLGLGIALGWQVVVVSMAGLMLAVLWMAAAAKAPQATKYATVAILIAVVCLHLLFNTIVRSRDDARQLIFTDHLRNVGKSMQQFQSLGSPQRPAAPADKMVEGGGSSVQGQHETESPGWRAWHEEAQQEEPQEDHE